MNKFQATATDIFVKVLIILFWLALLAIFLFSPKFTNVIAKNNNSLNIFCWVDGVDFKALKEFERTTGIKVNLSFYDQNYELFSKLKLTKGQDYDLIMVSDSLIDVLVKDDLLQELDKSKLDFWDKLIPSLLIEPQTKYLIPYVWDIYVVGYRKDKFKDGKIPVDTLAMLFDPNQMPKHILMAEEANEAIISALDYKFGDKFDQNNLEHWNELNKILTEQKKNVESYSNLRGGDSLLSGASELAYAQSTYICKARLENPDLIGIYVPKPYTYAVIDGYAISAGTKKVDLVYKFLNFTFSKKYMERVARKLFYLSSRADVLEEVRSCFEDKVELLKDLKKAKLFTDFVDMEKIYRLWAQVKSN